ncbi:MULTISPECIES: N-acetylmuramate alpha-1-phosphate uridylyltransferase MurU [unclassified Herbaspirillum]|uniref:N-acetylmuramate alpha-1-phosphate uridylyltransferase MurU n=1 Tax=unclassified Herbaspirillum TaxID=2624150 RepID=UPI001150FF78|nr:MULTISPECIES: nucleotidyltransferase family protein [unclassified Herbaspirillum]TQK09091.1 MurNAc alpha-1-phosphate uridylyltransferase [Herbaspirillum sp. SJZ130]TQK14222.1 MurNAc alpha-1-phosphate uridylyltransferase [Herbaspirillum sp. SJZ106]TWC69921.1 MurNAc alpha-1-phosphate uridylyltransferase [Herbaspirillum sp. SJZ099]
MKAMIFAAGRGERMRPLTDTCPKPLLKVRGRPLIVWQILSLVRAGITEIVINHAHLGQQIEEALGDGGKFGAQLHYSPEDSALETAGGIAKARHLLGEAPFVAVSGDIWCPHFDYEQVKTVLEDEDPWGNPLPLDKRDVAWIWLVKNPPFHPDGDFALNNFSIANEGENKLTFANIGVYRPQMFDAIAPGQHAKLGPLLREYAARGQVGGDVYRGDWHNVGTIDQLEALNQPPGGIRP